MPRNRADADTDLMDPEHGEMDPETEHGETGTPDAEMTDAERAKAEKAAKVAAAVAKVEQFTTAAAAPEDFRDATKPVRARNEVQLAMDRIAANAYNDWIAAGRPVLWQKIPVITYFLDADEIDEYKKLIRRACANVEATPYQNDDGETVTPTGVRARLGKEFVLREDMAAKIGNPDAAGKTVLAWAAIDKRKSSSNGDAPAE